MSHELVKIENAVERADTFAEVVEVAKVFAQSGFFQDVKEFSQAVVKIMYGRELGIPAVSSMMMIQVIQGKPSPSAAAIANCILRSGKYIYRVRHLDNDGCKLEFMCRIYNGSGEWESIGFSTFTEKDAAQCGALTGRNAHTWKAYRRNMLFSRAISNGARWFCPDIFGGAVYTPEELGGEESTTDYPVVEAMPVPQDSPQAPRPVDQEWSIPDPKLDEPKTTPNTQIPTPIDERRQDFAPTSTASTPILSPQAQRIVQTTQGMQKETYADASKATEVERTAKVQDIPEAAQAIQAGATSVQVQKDNPAKPGGPARVKFMTMCRENGIDTKDPTTMMGIISTILDREVTKGDLPTDEEWIICAERMEAFLQEEAEKQQEAAEVDEEISAEAEEGEEQVDSEVIDETTGEVVQSKPQLVMPQRSPHDVSINQLVAAGVRPAGKKGRVSQAELDAYWLKKGGAIKPQVEERQAEPEEQEGEETSEEVYECASQGCNNPVDAQTAQESARKHQLIFCRPHLDRLDKSVAHNLGKTGQAPTPARVPAGPPPATPMFTPVALPPKARTDVPAVLNTTTAPVTPRPSPASADALMDARKRFVAAAREWGIDTGRENLLSECTKALSRKVTDHNTLTVSDWEKCIAYIDPNNNGAAAEEEDPFAE